MSVRATDKKCFVSTSTKMLAQNFAHIVEKTPMRWIGHWNLQHVKLIEKSTESFTTLLTLGGQSNGKNY